METVTISKCVKALLKKLNAGKFIHDFQRTKLDISLSNKLKTTLTWVQDILNDIDVEEQQLTNPNPDLKKWLDMLRSDVFEVANLFEEIKGEALRRKVYETLTSSSTVLKRIFVSLFKRPHSVIDLTIQKFIERLECSNSALQLSGLGLFNSRSVSRETPTSSFESSIYGRNADINKLQHLLLSNSSDGGGKIGIISIVGMGGIGKTALARHLYNDPQVKDKFELKLWAFISKDFDIFRVLETILKSITSQSITSDEVNCQPLESFDTKTNDNTHVKTIYQKNTLLVTLQQVLKNKKFLLVLDDVLDAKSDDWMHLMDIFSTVETGSKIIITTRDERVALSMQTVVSVHYLRPLKSKDCWSIVVRYAFRAYYRTQMNEFEREMAKQCDGLPLAAVVLGKALFDAQLYAYDERDYMLGINIWELEDYKLKAALHSSYHYLSDPLKRCFAYCSIFPKKSILEKRKVVQLWVAEGLVKFSTSQESWKKVGEEYFDELVSRSLIHRQSIDGEEASFEMNNFFHDLATMVSFPYCITFDKQILHENVQYLSYNSELYDSFNKFDKLYGLKDLRTFLAMPLQEQVPLRLLSNKVVHDLLPTMKQLHALSLSNYRNITEVPKSIGDLFYLRYLNLSHTKIERLPSATCKLYNLQFLLVSGCRRLTELPEDMGKLVNLCHLDVSDTALREMPVQLAELENLQTLSDFIVSKHNNGLKVAELAKFSHLHGKLSISQLQNVNDPFEASLANMMSKEQIDELALEWDCGSTFSNSQTHSAVLQYLQPSTNLKSLTIKGYGGISFPNWLGDFLFSNMVYLRISNCECCVWLPPLGQLNNLKELIIEGMQSIEAIDTKFYGSDSSSFQPFLSLEILHFEDMKEWEEWNLIGGTATKFPSLKTLSLIKCPKLRVGNIHDKFPSLKALELRECPLLVQSTTPSDHVFNRMMFPLSYLQQLIVDGFPSLTSFPTDGLPKTLKLLIISNCENLEFLPHDYLQNYTSLEELKISYSCNSMISFTLGTLPVLKCLFIEGCINLKSILIAEGESKKSLSLLRSIKIWDCNKLESFASGKLATPNLLYIGLWKCENLHSLPEAMYNLIRLQEMEIDNLPSLQSFVIDELPSRIQKLSVGSVGGIMWNNEPTWEHLTCLSELRINVHDMVNTLMGPLLPKTLVKLCIYGLNDTSIDERWLQHLTSLQTLEIINAPKLKSLPKKGFPSSLSVLSVTCCPLLETSLREKRGNEWRKIAHIPSIVIDEELIT